MWAKIKQNKRYQEIKGILKRLLELIDYRFYVVIAIIWLLCKFIPGFIPDILNIQFLISEKEFITVLLTIITSLYGILIAFLLLSYGIFRDKFGRVALSFLIREKNLKFLVNLLLSVTIHLLLAYIIINNKEVISDFSITIAYISIFIFVISLFLLFPISFRTLSSPDSLQIIEDCIAKITKKDIDDLNFGYDLNDIESAIKIDENPISTVQRYGVSLIKSNDKLGFSLLLKKLNDKILEIIDKTPERTQIGINYRIFTSSLNTFITELVSQKDEKNLKNIWIIIELNHKHFADKRFPLIFLEELDFFTKNFINITLYNQLDNVTNFGLNRIGNILRYHYDHSLPPQDKISMLMDIFERKRIEQNVNIEMQWDKISHDFPYYYTIILRKCIELNNNNIFTSTLYHLNWLASDVVKTKIGEYQKASILYDLVSDFFYYQLEAFNNKLFLSCKEVKSLSTDICNSAIESDAIYKKRILSMVADFQIELLKMNKLDFSLMFPNYFGAVGRRCANKLHENVSFYEALQYILQVFDFLKKEFEKDLDNNMHNYSILKSEIESFIRFHLQSTDLAKDVKKPKELIDKKLLKELKILLAGFMDIKESELKFGQSIVKWK